MTLTLIHPEDCALQIIKLEEPKIGESFITYQYEIRKGYRIGYLGDFVKDLKDVNNISAIHEIFEILIHDLEFGPTFGCRRFWIYVPLSDNEKKRIWQLIQKLRTS